MSIDGSFATSIKPAQADRAALLRSPQFRGHDTGTHPENPERIVAIERELERTGLLAGRPEVPFGPATTEAIERIHDSRYVSGIAELARRGGGWLDADTMVAPDSIEVARLAAGAVVAAVDAVLGGRIRRAFVLERPPGHHATPTHGMGFCLFNAIAIGAAEAHARGLERIAILDWDVHHGNGTQDAFYDTERVLYGSVHQMPLYPGTGAASERGTGRGEGYTINAPLPPGQGDRAFARVFDELLLPAVRSYQPQLIMVSAGFDAHAADPLANMTMTDEGFAALAARVVAVADELCDGRLVLVLEGGYDPAALAGSVAAVIRVLDGHPAPLADVSDRQPRSADTREENQPRR